MATKLCGACHNFPAYIDTLSGEVAEFCSNKCRKTAVERGMIEPCINCGIMPRALKNGIRTNYCGKTCKNEDVVNARGRSRSVCQQCHSKPCYQSSLYCSMTCKTKARQTKASPPPIIPPPGSFTLTQPPPTAPPLISNQNTTTVVVVQTDSPPPYTPGNAFGLGDRKITRDDTFDDENPYGFRMNLSEKPHSTRDDRWVEQEEQNYLTD
ncbi:4182_t:CDS:2 [Ambispora leptoticha]|uniref:4182_t:CDS:1 n=1 Tax=Ambispora leptoticha TaxID=144679 RepID=A0A9N9CG80_9GLOM|nr:4182_t:CDS:2 [Ambispora leptoticha]